jgi:hypothetical protein
LLGWALAHQQAEGFGGFYMKRITLVAFVFVAILGLGFALTAQQTAAQDEMMTHICDSTLITLLYIAEYDYGFESMMDLSTFDKGQYTPLFDAMMMEDEDGMMEMTEEPMMEEEMMTEEPMIEEGMTMLMVGNIEGEDPACAELRAELNTFFYDTLTMMEDDGM